MECTVLLYSTFLVIIEVRKKGERMEGEREREGGPRFGRNASDRGGLSLARAHSAASS